MAAWPEPGWYFEPGGPQVARWWDGVAWGTYAPTASAPPAPPAIDRFGLPVEQTAADQIPGQQTALMDPATQVWLPPTGAPETATRSRGWLIALIVIVGLLVLFVPAIDVVARQHHSSRADLRGPGIPKHPSPPAGMMWGGYPTPVAGHPTFTLAEAPPQGYEGLAKVLTASGVGPMTTPTFHLQAGQVSGAMAQNGDGTSFFLVPVGGRPADQPTADCTDGCTNGGWSTRTALPAGEYRLMVQTGKKAGWHFELEQRVVSPVAVSVTGTETGSTVKAHGFGSQVTKPFRIVGAPGRTGAIVIGGDFTCDSNAIFQLEPVGSTHGDPIRSMGEAGTGGGVVIHLPGPGTYRLRVTTSGGWTYELDAS